MSNNDCETKNCAAKSKYFYKGECPNEEWWNECLEKEKADSDRIVLIVIPSAVAIFAVVTLLTRFGVRNKEFNDVLAHNLFKYSLPPKSYAVAAFKYEMDLKYKVPNVIGSLCLDLTFGLLWLPFRYIAYLIQDYPSRTPSSFLNFRSRGVRKYGGLFAMSVFGAALIVPIAVLETYRQREFNWKTYLIQENEKTKHRMKDYICKALGGDTINTQELIKLARSMKDMPVPTNPQDWNAQADNPEYNGFRKVKDWKSGAPGATTRGLDQYRMFSPGVFDDIDESNAAKTEFAAIQDGDFVGTGENAEEAWSYTMYDRMKMLVDADIVKGLDFSALNTTTEYREAEDAAAQLQIEENSVLALRNWCESKVTDVIVLSTGKIESISENDITMTAEFSWPTVPIGTPKYDGDKLKEVLSKGFTVKVTNDTDNFQMLLRLAFDDVQEDEAMYKATFKGTLSRTQNADKVTIEKRTIDGDYGDKTLQFIVDPHETQATDSITILPDDPPPAAQPPKLTSVIFSRTGVNQTVVLTLVFSEVVKNTTAGSSGSSGAEPSVTITDTNNTRYSSKSVNLTSNVLRFEFSNPTLAAPNNLLTSTDADFVNSLEIRSGDLNLTGLKSKETDAGVEMPAQSKYPLKSTYTA